MIHVIKSKRMQLLAASIEMLRAELEGKLELLRTRLAAHIPSNWPPELYDTDAIQWSLEALEKDPANQDWYFRYFVLCEEQSRTLIGAGGYKGPPRDRAVEIGYSILPEYRRRGFASEAARALTRHALEHPDVERVIAHTLPDLESSIAVLRNCGFALEGPGDDPDTIRYALSRVETRAE